MSATALSAKPKSEPGSALRKLFGRIAFGFSVLMIVSPAILVFLWMLSLAFKNEVDNMSYPPVFFPTEPTLNNFISTFQRSPFGLYTVNSIIVSGTATILALIVGVPAGYGVAKSKMQGLAAFVLISRMTPALSFLIPLFILFKSIGLTGTLYGLIITHIVITVPIVVWIMIGFFEDLHPELEEAALVDGCNVWGAFLHINMPLARPGIVVSGILAFIFSWNNFIFGVVLAGRETRTLPVAVYNSLTYEQVSWGPLAAAALIVTLPVLLLTIFFQKHIVTGLAAGGVKG
jgi:multiple sugar transport system permease protein